MERHISDLRPLTVYSPAARLYQANTGMITLQ